jgi:hypothetical protein
MSDTEAEKENKPKYTNQEALISEMLGDVLQLDVEVKKLAGTLPAQTQTMIDALDASKVDVIKSINEATRAYTNSIITQLHDHQSTYSNQINEYTEKLGIRLCEELDKRNNENIEKAKREIASSAQKIDSNKLLYINMVSAIVFAIFSSLAIGIIVYAINAKSISDLSQNLITVLQEQTFQNSPQDIKKNKK